MNIKSFLLEKWNWVKSKWKQFLAVLGVGILLAQVIPTLIPETPSLMIDGQLVEFIYTDNNTDENLIIHTTQENYMNFAGNITVYYSVLNNSGKDQTIKTVFSLKDGSGQKKYIKDISEYNGEETIEKVIPAHYKNIAMPIDEWVWVEETTTTEQITKWAKYNLTDFVLPAISKRKDIKNTHSLKNNEFLLQAGETKFFKAKIDYTDFKDREEFFIEAFGSLGAYGHLDPWTYEQLFNGLNDGNLTGQDSWTGGFSNLVQTTTKFEGAKGLKGTGGGVNNLLNHRILTAGEKSTAGTWYFAWRLDSGTIPDTNGQGISTFWQDADNVNAILIGMHRTSSGVYKIRYYISSWNDYKTVNLDTWYVIEIEYDGGANTYKLRVFEEGVGWDAQSGALSCRGTCAEIDGIEWHINANANVTGEIDTLTPTDPTVVSARRIINTQFIE